MSEAVPHADSPSRPVRVCFVIERLLSAGTELWITRLIERLDRRCVTPLLCLTDGEGELSHGLEPADCISLRLGLPHLRTPRILPAIARLSHFLRRHQVDIVQVHHADPSYLAIPAARLAKVPVVVQTKYDLGYWLTGFDLWMHRRLRPWVDITIANCQACRQAAIEQERAPASDVVIIDNGIDMTRLIRIPALTASEMRPSVTVGMVANLRPIKDPQLLLQAAKQLHDQGLPLTVPIAGDGPLRSNLEAIVHEAGMADWVTLHGHVDDTAAFLSRLQVFVLCSRSEGLPHALLEAMAAGRAVIATSVGGNQELITHGVTGLLVPPADCQALAAAIRRLVAEPQLAVELGQAARCAVADRFGLEAMTSRFIDFYLSALPNRTDAMSRLRRTRSVKDSPTERLRPTP